MGVHHTCSCFVTTQSQHCEQHEPGLFESEAYTITSNLLRALPQTSWYSLLRLMWCFWACHSTISDLWHGHKFLFSSISLWLPLDFHISLVICQNMWVPDCSDANLSTYFGETSSPWTVIATLLCVVQPHPLGVQLEVSLYQTETMVISSILSITWESIWWLQRC